VDLRTLRYFVAIADVGSMNAAAGLISIAQPALTRAMRELEHSLDVTLLQRTSRGVRLTAAGVTLYASAQRMLKEAQRVRQELDAQARVHRRVVTLGAPPTLARVLVPGILETCRRRVGMRLAVRESFTPVLLEWLAKGLIDVAVITKSETTARTPFLLQPLLGEPFALVTQRSVGLGPIVSAAELPHIPLLMTTLHREIVSQELSAVGVRLNIEAEVDSVDCIRELLLRGHGSTLMPVSVFKRAGSGAKLTLSEISGVQLSRQLLVAARAEKDAWPLVTALKELITEEGNRLVSQGMFSFNLPRKRRA
jgi:LysR family nitrogen assimilation transcriptional regulator